MKTMTSFCETEEISADMWRHQTELYLFTIIIRRFRSQQIETAVFNLNEVDLDTFKVSNDKIGMLTGIVWIPEVGEKIELDTKLFLALPLCAHPRIQDQTNCDRRMLCIPSKNKSNLPSKLFYFLS